MNKKEIWIEKTMKALEIDRNEALQLWADDHSDTLVDGQKELEQKAAAMNRRYEKAEKQPKKKSTTTSKRTVKVDDEKTAILTVLEKALKELNVSGLVISGQAGLEFNLNSNAYSVKLTKHRK